MPVSILILTLNEETNISQCLDSAPACDDVVVLDSFSSDGTVDTAKAMGARVVQRQFDNWAAHQNWAMESIDFRHRWVFYLDADERMNPELWQELVDIAANADEKRVAFYCGRKNYFRGRWLRHAMPPGMIMRFFRPTHVRFERLVNPTPVIQGEHGYLTHLMTHYNFSKGVAEWFEKHNRYSGMEAIEAWNVLRGSRGTKPRLFTKDPAARRKALKELSFRVPLRPLLRFGYMALVKRGILDGPAGLHYCMMVAMYEYWIDLKVREIRSDWSQATLAQEARLMRENTP